MDASAIARRSRRAPTATHRSGSVRSALFTSSSSASCSAAIDRMPFARCEHDSRRPTRTGVSYTRDADEDGALERGLPHRRRFLSCLRERQALGRARLARREPVEVTDGRRAVRGEQRACLTSFINAFVLHHESRNTHGEHEPAALDIGGLGARVGERFCEDAVQVRGRRYSAAGRVAGEQELLDRRREVFDRHRGGREQRMSSSSRAPQSAPRMRTMTLMANVREDFAPVDAARLASRRSAVTHNPFTVVYVHDGLIQSV
jgi:hypothetical protein